jgi:hypothetical protein
MTWEVEVSDEFIEWYDSLDEDEGVSVDTAVDMLKEFGPTLGRPYVDTLKRGQASEFEGVADSAFWPPLSRSFRVRSAPECLSDSWRRQNRER